MAHYAEINSNNKVIGTFVGKNEDEPTPEGYADWEEYYAKVTGNTIRRYSYNTRGGVYYTEVDGVPTLADDQSKAFRANLASVGDNWSEEHQIFYSDCDTDKGSWTLNTTTGLWEAPIPRPSTDVDYYWSEFDYQHDNTTGWIIYPEDT